MKVPPTRRRQLSGSDGVCPGATELEDRHVLLPLQVLRRRTRRPSEMTGRISNSRARAPDFDPKTSQPVVLLRSRGHGSNQFQRDHAGRGERGKFGRARRKEATRRATPALRDRPRRRVESIAVHRLHRSTPTASAARRRPDRRARRASGGEGSRAGAADRCAARRVQADRAHRRLGDARQGLAHAGLARGARRSARRRALPAPPLPLPRPRRGLGLAIYALVPITPRFCSST